MNKLEAADKLAEAVEKLLSDNSYLCAYCYQKNYEHSQGCAKQATMKLLEAYRQAPATPPLEKILAALKSTLAYLPAYKNPKMKIEALIAKCEDKNEQT